MMLVAWFAWSSGEEVRAGEAGVSSVSPMAELRAMSWAAEPPLTRSNAIRRIVQSFVPPPSGAVRALVILPGAIDDFQLVHRGAPLPAIATTNLGDVMVALTNATAWRLTFDPGRGRLMVHTGMDRVEARVRVGHAATAARLGRPCRLSKANWLDATWPTVQPALENALGYWVRPEAAELEAGHFERVNLVAGRVSELELIEAIGLASGTTMVIERRRVRFER